MAREVGCDLNLVLGKYLREEELIKQLLDIIDRIDVNELGIKNKFQEEVKRYNVFQSRVLKIEGKQENKDINVKSYIKYLLREGSMSEKREILACQFYRIH
mgnify:CR=1 FL=1